jgi:hypothetical protein
MTITVTVPATMSSDGLVHTYTDDSDPNTGLDGGGHVSRLVPLILDSVSVASYVVTQTTTTVTLSSQWATLTTGLVASTDYSAKAWAIGGTGVDTIGGSAKDWAIKETTVGNSGLKSAKSYADLALTNGASQVALATTQSNTATTGANTATTQANAAASSASNALASANTATTQASNASQSANSTAILLANAGSMLGINFGAFTMTDGELTVTHLSTSTPSLVNGEFILTYETL